LNEVDRCQVVPCVDGVIGQGEFLSIKGSFAWDALRQAGDKHKKRLDYRDNSKGFDVFEP